MLVKVDVQALIARGRASPPTSVTGVVDGRSVDEIYAEAQTARAEGREVRGDVRVFVMPRGWYCQESRFVARRGGTPSSFLPTSAPTEKTGHEVHVEEGEAPLAEDDGYLLTYTFDESQLHPITGEAPPTSVSELWIVDARDMHTVLARIQLPQRVPYGLHGAWFSREEVEGQREVLDVRRLPVSLERKRREDWWRVRRLEESLGGMVWGGVRGGVERWLG